MLVIIGFIIVIGSVILGYLWEHGNLSLLYQPAEFLIIGGGALGGLIVASSPKILKNVMVGLISVITCKPYSKDDYMNLLLMTSGLFLKIRKEGLRSIEKEVDNPQDSKFFKKHPGFQENKHALYLLTDTFRTLTTTKLEGYQLEGMLDADIDGYHDELMVSSKSMASVADALPGLGIVAAVLGIVITMQNISAPPDVLGHSIGAALVGTFLGVLLSYGFVGPLARKLENIADEKKEYLIVLRAIVVAFVSEVHPQICVEFGRMLIPDQTRPSFLEVEERVLMTRRIEVKKDKEDKK